jgi:hypothetical protein
VTAFGRLWNVVDRLSPRQVLAAQSVYYLVTGLWPVVHFPSFRFVVGPKPDRFQFFTTTWLIVVIGTALGFGARARRPDPAVATLGVVSAAAFVGVEAWYLRSIRKVFLVDLLAELIFALVLLRAGRRRGHG